MAFPQNTIKLEAAQKIFVGVTIEPCMIGEKVAYYQAEFNGKMLQHTSLTELCSMLWNAAMA